MKYSKKHLPSIVLGALAHSAYFVFRLLPLDTASAIGAKIVCLLGPHMKGHAAAKNNLRRVMPELTDAEIESIVMEMWENLGRVIGEFPHIPNLKGEAFWSRITLLGSEHLDTVKQAGKGGIVYSGHFGNWEFAPKSAYEYGMPLALVYRPANNPYVETLYRRSRANSHVGLFAKGKESARNIIRVLKEGGYVGMLIDQKMNDGIPIPFFGELAMTAPAIADLGLKFNCPLIGARVVRTKGAYFNVEVFPPLDIQGKSREAIMTEVNAQFETWIREHPAQWLWMHRRWPRPDERERLGLPPLAESK